MRALAIILLLCPTVSAAAASSVASEFSGPTLVFTLTVANPDSVMRHVTKVGVNSRPHGNFNCLADSSALPSLADYAVEFSVLREETLTAADPKIRLSAGSSATFTVSLYPHATGACGPWSSDVSVVVVFDDGSRVATRPSLITEADLAALRIRSPVRDEVLLGLSHRNADLRLHSLRQLGNVGLDRVTLEDKLRFALQDPDTRVRSEAYRQIAPLNLQALTPELLKRFATLPLPVRPAEIRRANSKELLQLAQALTMLPAGGAEDSLLAVLTDPHFLYPEPLGDALRKIHTLAMPGKLVQALTSHRAWADAPPDNGASAENPRLATRYDVLLQSLIDYRDVSSIPLLKSLLTPTANRRTARVILSHLLTFTVAAHRVQDPFVLAFRDGAHRLMSDPWGDDRHTLREPAMLLSVRTSDDTGEQAGLLRTGLHDRSQYVQLAAAGEAAALDLAALAPDVSNSFRRADDALQPYFCNALTALHTKCHDEGDVP